MNTNSEKKLNRLLLYTLALSGIVMFSCRVKRIGTVKEPSKDIAVVTPDNNKASVPVDSLVWYTGPIDTFASYEAYKEYLIRQRDLIRETPLDDFSPEVHIKMPDGSIMTEVDVPRAGYHVKINNDSVPQFLRSLFPGAEFYYGKLNIKPNDYSPGNSNLYDIICRINGRNYMIPNDVNIIFDETSKKVSIEKKIEFLISLRKGLHTNYKIISIIPKEEKIGHRLSSYEIIFYMDNKKYIGHLGLNKNEIDFLYINEEAAKGMGLLLMYGSKLSY